MSAQIWKISDAAMKAVGATSPDQFDAKLVEMLQANAALAGKLTTAESSAKAANDSVATLASKLEAAEKTIASQALAIAGLDAKLGNPATMTETKISEIATKAGEAAGSKMAGVEAVGAVGAGTLVAPPAVKPAAGGSAQFDALVKTRKFEEAFAFAPANIKAEFIDPKSYAAFMKFNARGQVKITEKQ